MRYKCLVLDHDDTAVKSTAELHYPAFRIIMDRIRPGSEQYDLAEFTRKCFYPGFSDFCRGELGFTDEEMDLEYRIWKDYIKDKMDNKKSLFYHKIVTIGFDDGNLTRIC